MHKLSILSLLIATTFSFGVSASTGTITFTGEITASTCDVDIDGNGPSATITMPTISAANLDADAKTAGDTAFYISLSNCTGILKTASAFFEAGTNVNTNGRLTNTGSAKNVDIQLLDVTKNSSVINIGSPEQINNAGYVDVAGGSALVPYISRYYATGKSDPGTVQTAVTYSIQYK
ncbi:type 1 fimbrial protein [Citrobacter sp. Cs237]|uniref:fimbrial protein n=1 Tax=Citrobacter sp. Cs237 TaxID=2985156 RepID=UPI0025772DC3|nr:fimbrial protein [Citrobacter sp. Cs237]MDM2751686.1 type 1 fimbrial protein [Citrobacter sp. Cs237]